MKIITSLKPLVNASADLLLIGLFEDERRLEPKIKALDAALAGRLSQILKRGDFKGQSGETYLLDRLLLVGLGQRADYNLERLRLGIAAAAPFIQKFKVTKLAVAFGKYRPHRAATAADVARTIIESILFSNYRFVEHKNLKNENRPAPLETIEFILNNPRDKVRVLKGAAAGQTLGRAVNSARTLGNHPSNVATPAHLAEHALSLAKNVKNIRVNILERDDMAKEKMGALLAVARGSDEPPKFIILEYQGKKTAPKTVLVGKGVTFDSGGISLKPSEKMEEMKFDMAGGATVMGIIQAAAELKLPLYLVGLIAAVENLPSGKALKPGDIVRTRSGKTVEVVNTDAEGRMVLIDVLDYAKKYDPELVIDFATLTGTIVAALGDDITGVFANREKLLPKLRAAAEITGEKIWPMPLEPSYESLLESEIADLRNQSVFRYGDAIHAANFLKNFVDYPWLHLDIAGTAWATREKPGCPKGATGAGIRLAVEFLKNFKN